MRVFILAGGLGTRIRSLFPDRPKSMIPFGGKPFLEHLIALLSRQGFCRFVLCVSHQAEAITAYFGDGQRLGVEIVYSQEPAPLGTGGALRYAAPFFDALALVLNGDTYLDTDYQAVVAYHRQHPGASGTIVVCEVGDAGQSGQVLLDASDRIVAFREKQTGVGRGLVNAGVYVFEPHILDYIPAGAKVSLEREVFPSLLRHAESLYGFVVRETFVDMGTPAGYQRLEAMLNAR
ncbi:MAG TPA: nucleotidyltransferase family protein [Anaerolineae bacterium]|nr:nucleotidyltransferase family protein [Anaerolineae bacterium]HQK12433.1 nucleotidyltransferase family protein [Anaerolineae bacterium]